MACVCVCVQEVWKLQEVLNKKVLDPIRRFVLFCFKLLRLWEENSLELPRCS